MADENCPICGGSGWKIVERAGLSGAERCRCSHPNRPQALQESANIPPNYENASLDSFELPRDNPIAASGLGNVLLQVRRFVREFPPADRPGLLLIGDPGAGKTHLAVGVMKALMEKGHECVFFDYQNLIERIRSGWDAAAGASDREVYSQALETEVLVVDDLGAHRVVEWVQDTIESLITQRCNHRKALIATTNLPDPDVEDPLRRKTLAESIGMRARSRLFEMCRVVRMPAIADYRVQHGRIVKI
jgi:DNA replication protein DnaC